MALPLVQPGLLRPGFGETSGGDAGLHRDQLRLGPLDASLPISPGGCPRRDLQRGPPWHVQVRLLRGRPFPRSHACTRLSMGRVPTGAMDVATRHFLLHLPIHQPCLGRASRTPAPTHLVPVLRHVHHLFSAARRRPHRAGSRLLASIGAPRLRFFVKPKTPSRAHRPGIHEKNGVRRLGGDPAGRPSVWGSRRPLWLGPCPCLVRLQPAGVRRFQRVHGHGPGHGRHVGHAPAQQL